MFKEKRFLIVLLLASVLASCEPLGKTRAAGGLAADKSDAGAASERAVSPLLHVTELATNPRDRRVAVLLHGYGSNEFDLIPLARRLGFEGPVESFVGPIAAGQGHAWFPVDFRPGGVRYAPDAADVALEQLAVSLGELRETHEGFELVVIGFSQGAMMTMMLAAEHPEALDRGIALSGALPRALRPAARATYPPVFMAHGTADAVVPFERGKQAHTALEQVGVPVRFRAYEGLRHGTDERVVADVAEWAGSFR